MELPASFARLLMSSWTDSLSRLSFKNMAAAANSSGVTFPSESLQRPTLLSCNHLHPGPCTYRNLWWYLVWVWMRAINMCLSYKDWIRQFLRSCLTSAVKQWGPHSTKVWLSEVIIIPKLTITSSRELYLSSIFHRSPILTSTSSSSFSNLWSMAST